MKAEEWIDPLCPSAVLLSYLNELPSSLLPPDMYEKFIGIAGKILSLSLQLLQPYADNPCICRYILLHYMTIKQSNRGPRGD